MTEEITNGQQYEADYTPGADQARVIASWVSDGIERGRVYRVARDILNAIPAAARADATHPKHPREGRTRG